MMTNVTSTPPASEAQEPELAGVSRFASDAGAAKSARPDAIR